jgi:Family of unknown function (DUF6328)
MYRTETTPRSDPHRTETTPRPDAHRKRAARSYAELLQELRVAQIGVQVLFAFLLGGAFTPRFSELSGYQRGLFAGALLLTLMAWSLLTAPVPYHRALFRRRLKAHIVEATSRFATAGLTVLAFATSTALLLVLTMVLGYVLATVITAACIAWYGTWWYAVPMAKRPYQSHSRKARS